MHIKFTLKYDQNDKYLSKCTASSRNKPCSRNRIYCDFLVELKNAILVMIKSQGILGL